MKNYLISIIILAAAYLSMPVAAVAQWEDTLWTRDLTPEASYASRFTPDGKYVIASVGKTICKFDALTGDMVFRSKDTTEDIIKRIDFSNIFSKIITWSSWDMVINIWDSSLENIIKKLDYKPIKGKGATCMAISRDDKYLLIGLNIENTGNLLLYELDKDQEVKSINVTGRLLEVVFSPDGKYFVTASLDYNEIEKYQYSHLYLWKTENWEFVQELGYLKDKVINLNFSPDGSLLVVARESQPLTVWNIESRLQVKEYTRNKTGQLHNNAIFSPDLKYLILASGPPPIHLSTLLWDYYNDSLIYKYYIPSHDLDINKEGNKIIITDSYNLFMLAPKWSPTSIYNYTNDRIVNELTYIINTLNISINLPYANLLILDLYDSYGRKINTYNLGYFESGIHKFSENITLSAGVYFAILRFGGQSITKQFDVVR